MQKNGETRARTRRTRLDVIDEKRSSGGGGAKSEANLKLYARITAAIRAMRRMRVKNRAS